MEPEVAGGELSEDQAAALAALSAAAEEGEPAPGGEDAEPAMDPAQAWATVPKLFGSVLAVAMPELARVYTDDACMSWGRAMVPVAEKYGWSADAMLGPEMGLLVASLPLVLGTVAVVKKHRDAAGKKPEKAATADAAAVVMEGLQTP